MPRSVKLTWQDSAEASGRTGRWRKKYKGKTYYFPGGRGKSDREAYDVAVAAWEAKKLKIDHEPHVPTSRTTKRPSTSGSKFWPGATVTGMANVPRLLLRSWRAFASGSPPRSSANSTAKTGSRPSSTAPSRPTQSGWPSWRRWSKSMTSGSQLCQPCRFQFQPFQRRQFQSSQFQ